jgi:hypothetical protein
MASLTESLSRPTDRRLSTATASTAFPITRSSRSLKGTAPAAISGKPPSAFSMRRSKGLSGEALGCLVRSLCRREGQGSLSELASRRHHQRHPRISRRHQRSADHARRRRHPLAQRRPAPDPRSLFGCVRPVKYYAGVPSPVKHPERMNIVIFRENTEDVYMGIEWEEGTPMPPG